MSRISDRVVSRSFKVALDVAAVELDGKCVGFRPYLSLSGLPDLAYVAARE